MSTANKQLHRTPNDEPKTGRFRQFVVIGYYGGLSLLMLSIFTQTLQHLVPPGVATSIGHNSEAYLFALVLAAWIQFVRPRLLARDARSRWTWTTAAALGWALIGLGLHLSDLPSRFRTLDESSFALAILIPFVMLRRPLTRWVFAVIPALIALTAWGVTLEPDGWTPAPEGIIVDQAETIGFVMLAIIAFDAIDRGILNPEATTRAPVRYVWYVFLAVEPVVISVLGVGVRQPETLPADIIEWLGRVHESFIGILLVSLLFAVVLRQTGRTAIPRQHAQEPSRS